MSTKCCLEGVLNRLQRIWLLNARKRKNFTHADVAKRINVKRQYYGMIENGKRTPSVNIAKKIADVLDVDWTLFF
nr:helix-turn-helix transcriptional regulator [Caenibacillus caldisaponilyticus]